MKSLGDMIKAITFGFTAGLVSSVFLLSIGDNTDEIIYGASVPMTRFYVTVVCSVACLVAEMLANTSAREVAVDVVISWLVSLLFVGDKFLISVDKMESIKHMMGPIVASVILASILSNPIQQCFVKFFEWVPFKKKE